MKRGIQNWDQRTQPSRRSRLVAKCDSRAIAGRVERQRIDGPEPSDRAFVFDLVAWLHVHQLRACRHPYRATGDSRLVRGTWRQAVTTDSAGRAHIGVPPMKHSHVGKESEYDARRTIDLEVPRKRDHEVQRIRVITSCAGRGLLDSLTGAGSKSTVVTSIQSATAKINQKDSCRKQRPHHPDPPRSALVEAGYDTELILAEGSHTALTPSSAAK